MPFGASQAELGRSRGPGPRVVSSADAREPSPALRSFGPGVGEPRPSALEGVILAVGGTLFLDEVGEIPLEQSGPGGAAELLGIKPTTLASKLEAFGLRPKARSGPGRRG